MFFPRLSSFPHGIILSHFTILCGHVSSTDKCLRGLPAEDVQSGSVSDNQHETLVLRFEVLRKAGFLKHQPFQTCRCSPWAVFFSCNVCIAGPELGHSWSFFCQICPPRWQWRAIANRSLGRSRDHSVCHWHELTQQWRKGRQALSNSISCFSPFCLHPWMP